MRNKDREASEQASNNATFSRRNMLLAGTTFAAVSALASAAPVRTAQAQPQQPQQQPAPTGRQAEHPGHLGRRHRQTNISAYSSG